MSGKRKNSGAGYGYMFSGAFAKKADAVKKEKKRKGSFVKAVMMKSGMRYAVMTPRVNPIKRKKKIVMPGAMNKQQAERKAIETSKLNNRPFKAVRVKYMTGESGWDVTPVKNPSELLIMGANPHEGHITPVNNHDITVPSGSTLTIRMNPEPRTNWMSSARAGIEAGQRKLQDAAYERQQKVRKRATRAGEKAADDYYMSLKKSARASIPSKGKLRNLFHEVYGKNPEVCGAKIGNYTCSRKPGHRGPHLPQGATLRPRSRHTERWTNPSAATLREEFTGMPAEHVSIQSEPHMPAGDYAQLGELLALYVKPRHGGPVQQINFSKNARPLVLSDESGRQIWFAGGDQNISPSLDVFGRHPSQSVRGNLFELGEVRRIDYRQRKEHVTHPEHDEWRHDLGEENEIRPTLLFDTHAKRLLLQGGDYSIRREGIIN